MKISPMNLIFCAKNGSKWVKARVFGQSEGGLDLNLTMEGLRRIDGAAQWQSVHVYLNAETDAEEFCRRLKKEYADRLSYAEGFEQIFYSQLAPITDSVRGIDRTADCRCDGDSDRDHWIYCDACNPVDKKNGFWDNEIIGIFHGTAGRAAGGGVHAVCCGRQCIGQHIFVRWLECNDRGAVSWNGCLPYYI